MRHNRFEFPDQLVAGLLVGLLVAILALPLSAVTKTELHPYYDITKEIQLSGMASSVVAIAPRGMMPGPHIMVETASGTIDASLGKWGLQGKAAPSIQNGEQVTMKGVMKTVKDKQIFIVRTLEVGGRTYTIRNEHGLPLSPQGRPRMNQTVLKGVSQ